MRRTRRRTKNRKRILYFKTAFILVLLIFMINSFKSSFSKYRSNAVSIANVDLAFYFVKVETISQELQLDSILPREDTYTYTFTVSNFNGDKRTDTAIDYDIEIKATTNLPLNYSIHKVNSDTNLITDTENIPDADGTYFKYIKATGDSFGFEENETHTYEIEIEFPEQFNSAEYENIVEYIKLTINSTQKTS